MGRKKPRAENTGLEILKDLTQAVVAMDEAKATELAHEAVASGIDAYRAITEGLSKGMEVAGDKYVSGEYFIPELLLCSDAMNAGIEVLKPHLKAETVAAPGKIVIGVVEGDTHDIGKNLVKLMLEASGFSVTDLGRNVPLDKFIDQAEEIKADLIAISSLMTTTIDGMEQVIARLEKENLRTKYKVIVGGAAVAQSFADKIGADGYGANAAAAVALTRKLVNGNGNPK